MSNNNKRQPLISRPRRHFSLKKRIVIAVIVICVISIGAATWYFVNNSKKNKSPADNQKILELAKLQEKAQKSFNIYNEASKSVLSGNYDAGQAVLDKAIQGTSDNAEQASLYLQKSSIAINAGKYDDAYNFAKKAEDLNASVDSAKMMADAAVRRGDKDDAIVKYKLAISRITGTSEQDGLDKQDLQNNIKQLGG